MTMTSSERQEWLADLKAALDPLIRDAENFAAFGHAKPPTERVYADALNAIRYARWFIRNERARAKVLAEAAAAEGAM